jgi:flagellar hook-length control protein FliK
MQLLPLVERAGTGTTPGNDSVAAVRSASDMFAVMLARQTAPLPGSEWGERAGATAQGTAEAAGAAAGTAAAGAAGNVAAAASEVASFEQTLAASQAAGTAEQAQDVVTPPPSVHSLSGRDSSPGKVKISSDDLDKLKPALLANGLSKDDLDKLAEQAASQVGLSWAQLVSFVNQKVAAQAKTVEVSQVERQYLSSFFGKVGFTPQQSSELVDRVASGKGESVLREIQAKLKAQSQDSTVAVAKEEVQALGRVLGFSADAQVKLNQYMSLTGAGMSAGDLGKAVALMQQEAAQVRQARIEGLNGLKTAMAATLGKAKVEADRERQADWREDSKGKDMQLLASAAKEARGEAAADDEHVAKETVKAVAASAKAAKDGQAERKAESQADLRAEHKAGQQAQARSDRHDQADGEAKGQAGREGRDGAVWKELADKVRIDAKTADPKAESWSRSEDRAARSVSSSLSGAAGASGLSAATNGAGGLAGTLAGFRPEFGQELEKVSRQDVLRQVQSGILTRLNQGGKQLTLELEPDSLGKVNVMLQVQGKDVRAVIRTDSDEVGKLLGDQIAAIKESLESQGFKVSGVEVQTGLAQNGYGDVWQGRDQERQANEEALARMMSRRRQPGLAGGDSADVVRVMQNDPQQAHFSRSGVDLFA